MKVIRFLKSVPPYNGGETAAFTNAQAAHYLSLPGVAEDPNIKYKGPVRSPELDPVPEKKMPEPDLPAPSGLAPSGLAPPGGPAPLKVGKDGKVT
jgi:hypothetical protein